MKKKLLYGLAVVVIAAVAAFNMNVSSNEYGLSDVSLANVEALAQGENPLGDCRYDPGYYCCVYWYGSGEMECTPYNWNWW